MTTPDPDQPLRWVRGSPQEDFEVERAIQHDRLGAWTPGQQSFSDTLSAGRLCRDDRESWITYKLPPGWADIKAPELRCSFCERPAADSIICDPCVTAQDATPDPAALLEWWQAASPDTRRMQLAIRHSVDPWSGQHCTIRCEVVSAGEGVSVVPARLNGIAPRTSWDLPPAT